MKNNKKYLSILTLICMALGLLSQILIPTVAIAAEEIIYIESADDLIELAKKCSYDAWSEGKTVILKNDISLEDKEFSPISTFSGVFDGQGYTISGIVITESYSPAGLFSRLEKDAEVKDLTVKGVISPDGDGTAVGGIVGENRGRIEGCEFIGTIIGSSDVGGIVGINRVNGAIVDCASAASVIGENRVGGIAGSNEGLISSSEGNSKVNTVIITPALSLEDINLTFMLDLKKLPSISGMTTSDIGGIAGYNNGIIIGCTNNGAVGYPHIGYNVGGIAGRSNGHLSGNVNNAVINGRKDVGGIVGQVEPHVSYNLSEDLLLSLKNELNRLEGEINSALGSAGNGMPTVSSRLDTILENLSGATDSLNTLINQGTDYGNDFIGQINRVSEILSEVISKISGITDELPTLSETLGNSLADLEKALENIEDFSALNQDTLQDVIAAIDDAALAFGYINESIDKINTGIGAFKNSLMINDKAAAEASLEQIADQLSKLIHAADDFTNAVNDVAGVLDDVPWIDDAVKSISEFADVFSKISESMSTIYEATLEISENIDIYWNKFEAAGDETVILVGHLADMTESLADAAELIDSGVGKIKQGLSDLKGSVVIQNPEMFKEAINAIGDGLNQIVDASAESGLALSELIDTLKALDGSSEANEAFASLFDSIVILAEQGIVMTKAISTVGKSVIVIIDGTSFDFDAMDEGGNLIVGGIGDLSDSMTDIKDAISSMSNGMVSLKRIVTDLNEAITVKDEEKLSAALDDAYEAIGKIIEATSKLAVIFKDMSTILGDATEWGKELSSAIKGVTEAMTDMSDALVQIQDGIDSLRDNISFDTEDMRIGLIFIRGGLDAMADAADAIKGSFGHISDALVKIDNSSEHLNAAVSNMRKCIGGLSKAMNSLTLISEEIGGLVGYLKGVETVQLPTIPDSISVTANQMFIYISAIENELKYLNTDITGMSEELIISLGKINEIFGNLSDNLVDIIYSFNDGSIIDGNVSEEEIESVTLGRLFSCVNSGSVNGDINVGGICGAMGIEYTLDPEDDLTVELSVTQKKQYKLKAVIHACHNSGDVISKYDCAGGIVGKMDIGLIYGSESYATVESQSGNYVGGIAGITAGLISQCFAKSALYGGKYVGGIVGSGVTESFSGYSSTVRNCYSMVEIKRASQYSGAISGIYSGEYSENLFVSDSLAGIDRVSYYGKAEPISYQDLIKRRSIPDEFYHFVLEFVADGRILHSVKFEYGSSFDSSEFPEIPVKEGHYGYWDITSLQNLVFDTTVTVVYKPYTTTVEGDAYREDGREVFLVQGEFTENDKVTVKEGCDVTDLNLIEKFFTKDNLIESWTLIIPKDNVDKNRIHFLPQNENCKILVKVDGVWQEIGATEFGSYLVFEISGEEIELAIVEHSIKLLPVLMLSGGGLVILCSVVIICVIMHRKNKRAKESSESEEE